MLASPESCPALGLNADFRSLSYLPLCLWPGREAAKSVLRARVDAVISLDIVKSVVSLYVQRHSRTTTQHLLERSSVVKRKFDYSRFGGMV